MRAISSLGVLLMLASCEASGPPDCEQLTQEIYSCFDRVAEQPIMDDFESCIPMGEAEEIEGTWARDFEMSLFHENQRLSFDEAVEFPETVTTLWNASDIPEIGSPEMRSVVWVRFIGRRPVCEASDWERQITIDQILEQELIEERPSPWHTSNQAN